MSPYYKDYSDYLAEIFDGKVQKLSIDADFGCPNRDGTIGTGGCTYCNNRTFSPDFAKRKLDVSGQLAAGKKFFARKYPSMRYLAYFQSYTNTYDSPERLMQLYREALAVDDVVGLIIGTRPDCMPDELLEGLKELNTTQPVFIEYGAESSHNRTLELINRCHTWEQTIDAVKRTADAGLHVGLHLIMGLPGETTEMMLETIDRINELPVQTIKLHQLQIIRGTKLARDIADGLYSVTDFTVEQYIDLCCEVIRRLRKGIAIERFVSQSPANMLISPRWGLKNYQFTNLLHNKLSQIAK
jgi:radical SAM protein (TIGR01212 family)